MRLRARGRLIGEPMTPETLQLLRMVRDGEDPHAPTAPWPVRQAAARHIEQTLQRQLIATVPVFVLTPKGRHLLEHEEAMLAGKSGALDGAALARPGEPAHRDLEAMAAALASACQALINAMPHGHINFAVVVYAGDASQLEGAPAWAYAMAGNMNRAHQQTLLEQQVRVLDERMELETAIADNPDRYAASVHAAPRARNDDCAWCGNKRIEPRWGNGGVYEGTMPCQRCRPDNPPPLGGDEGSP